MSLTENDDDNRVDLLEGLKPSPFLFQVVGAETDNMKYFNFYMLFFQSVAIAIFIGVLFRFFRQ